MKSRYRKLSMVSDIGGIMNAPSEMRGLDEEENTLIALSRIEDKPDELLTTEQLWKRLGWSKDLTK